MPNQSSQKQIREELEDAFMDDQFEEKFRRYSEYQKSVNKLREEHKDFYSPYRSS